MLEVSSAASAKRALRKIKSETSALSTLTRPASTPSTAARPLASSSHARSQCDHVATVTSETTVVANFVEQLKAKVGSRRNRGLARHPMRQTLAKHP